MKKILGLLLAATIITPLTAFSGDSQYPAANFQPTIIFADESAKASGPATQTAFDAKYPATSFQPIILYVDASAIAASESFGETSSFDSNYPAANFAPKVIYP